jgi:hypothetical protein
MGQLKMAGINVFGNPSKKESLVRSRPAWPMAACARPQAQAQASAQGVSCVWVDECGRVECPEGWPEWCRQAWRTPMRAHGAGCRPQHGTLPACPPACLPAQVIGLKDLRGASLLSVDASMVSGAALAQRCYVKWPYLQQVGAPACAAARARPGRLLGSSPASLACSPAGSRQPPLYQQSVLTPPTPPPTPLPPSPSWLRPRSWPCRMPGPSTPRPA